jgi:glutathione S-transferase
MISKEYIGMGIIALTITYTLLSKAKPKKPTLTQKGSKKIILCTSPQSIKFPQGSASVCKLKAFLDHNSLDYELRFITDYDESPNKKIPFIHYNGEILADSHFIIKRLITDGLVKDPDAWLDQYQKSISEFISTSLESKLYWGIVKERWIDQWILTKQTYFDKLPLFLFFIPSIVQKEVIKNLYSVGTTRYTDLQYTQLVNNLFEALDVQLSDNQFMHGDAVSLVDYTAFGQLANVLYLKELNPKLYDMMVEYPRLVAYTDRLRLLFNK